MKQFYKIFIGSIIVLFGLSAYMQANEKKPSYMTAETSPKALVVIYSYTGNTKAVADEIAKKYNADMVVIKAEKYDEFMGSTSASTDAWNEEKDVDIKPKTIDMEQYDLIFLGSPIWWYRPAVPLWTFAGNNDFKGKDIVLFNTFNSRFKQKYIDEFKDLITKNNGNFLKHIYVRRGRWYSQLSQEGLIEKFNNILKKSLKNKENKK